ncbi:hypothetical protein CVIRNUC_000766 [Coccomyxa viridis]|uniref:Uncharacterized protein n=1 Tax=Coccomyxa viridis TaxID=1274662 RepID=A0AAV1HR98_9CHLO|nr:hypothetical protein CVIRNUC_000766 [Coccomyxa viridis]
MENKESHNGRSIESLEQGGKQYNQAQCPASKADPLEIIDWDDRRPGYDPDKDLQLPEEVKESPDVEKPVAPAEAPEAHLFPRPDVL